MNEEDFTLLLSNIYWYSAIIVFICIGFWEVFAPARKLSKNITSRWVANFALLVSVYLVVYLIKPIIISIISLVTENFDIGVFNIYKSSIWIELVFAVLILDIANYIVHRLLHAYAWGWRFHRVHHSDIDVDLSTGWRFHPLEGILSALVHSIVIALLGLSLYVVIAHIIIARTFNMFTHGNIAMPIKIDKALSLLFITPSLHLVHHSIIRKEHDTNYGNIFSLWDRMFGTLNPKLISPKTSLITGLNEFRSSAQVTFINLLFMPFYKASNISKEKHT